MGYWNSSINVCGNVEIDLNEEVMDRSEDVIKLFTDEELNEELHKREIGRSRHENRIEKLNTTIYNIYTDVDVNDVLNEIDNEDLLYECESRNLKTIEFSNIGKYDLRKVICKALDINEMYDDEEIFEMLREIWKIWR